MRRRGGSDRQRHAMHYHWIALANPVEYPKRLAARQHVVFADDLEPVDRRMAAQNFVVVLRPQSKAKTKERRLGGIHLATRKRWHRRLRYFAGDVHTASVGGRPETMLAQSTYSLRTSYIITKIGPGAWPGP